MARIKRDDLGIRGPGGVHEGRAEKRPGYALLDDILAEIEAH